LGYYGWFASVLISSGGAWIWLKLVTKTDPNWKHKQHRWYLYVISGIGSVYLGIFFYYVGFLITGGGFYSKYAVADDFWFFILINGPAEEWAKFFVFLLLAKGFKKVKEPRDGVLVAMMVALGFSLWENVHYIFTYGNVATRLLVSSTGHMSYAAIWGYFTGEAILNRRNESWFDRNKNALISVFVLSFIHGFFNFLVTWVSFGAGLLLKSFLYIATLTILYNVCRIPSSYRSFSYEESSEAVRSIRQALKRDNKNPILWKKLGFYELALGHRDNREALDSWKNIEIQKRDPYLNSWICVLTSLTTKNVERSGFERHLRSLGLKGRRSFRGRLKYFLKKDASVWIRRIDAWEKRHTTRTHR